MLSSSHLEADNQPASGQHGQHGPGLGAWEVLGMCTPKSENVLNYENELFRTSSSSLQICGTGIGHGEVEVRFKVPRVSFSR